MRGWAGYFLPPVCERVRTFEKQHRIWHGSAFAILYLTPGRMGACFGFFQKNITFQPFWNMKFFKFRNFFTIILLMTISLPASWAQGNRDFMRETGKINVVVGVILLIFLGIVLYLVRLERKLTRLEHQLNDEKNEWTN